MESISILFLDHNHFTNVGIIGHPFKSLIAHELNTFPALSALYLLAFYVSVSFK